MIECCQTEYRGVSSGVVQGSQIGPLLFIIFVNGIIDLTITPSVYKLFADDVKLYSKIQYPFTDSLTQTLQRIEEWSLKWQMRSNPDKSSTMKLGKNKSDISYSINGIKVPVVQSVRDLGLSYDSSLKFDDYIHKITTRAYQRIGLIFRGFISGNRDLLKRAFIVYVRPILEYCTCVWSPYLLKVIHKIENVQRYFTRRLFPYRSHSYKERLQLINLEPLETRRLKYDLKMYFKIIQNLINIKVYSFIKSQVTYRTSLQSKYRLYEIRPTGPARRLATRWVRERPCKQINMQRKLQLNTISFLRWRHICHVSFWCWWESIPGSLAWEAR